MRVEHEYDRGGALAYLEPCASADRVFWTLDNGNSHRGQASVDRLEREWKNLRLVHVPVQDSWLNQVVEIFFSVVQRKAIRRGRCPTYRRLNAKGLAYTAPPANPAKPSHWQGGERQLQRSGRRPTR
jgi:hypothetical protein